jgi:hypothetical protein
MIRSTIVPINETNSEPRQPSRLEKNTNTVISLQGTLRPPPTRDSTGTIDAMPLYAVQPAAEIVADLAPGA